MTMFWYFGWEFPHNIWKQYDQNNIDKIVIIYLKQNLSILLELKYIVESKPIGKRYLMQILNKAFAMVKKKN